ncbi:MAG: hypothetical protein N2C14_26720, partial [Planctomycetales bacterium]
MTLLSCLFSPVERTKSLHDQGLNAGNAPWSVWMELAGIAILGSMIVGACMSLLPLEWDLPKAALWLTLSTGMSWC